MLDKDIILCNTQLKNGDSEAKLFGGMQRHSRVFQACLALWLIKPGLWFGTLFPHIANNYPN